MCPQVYKLMLQKEYSQFFMLFLLVPPKQEILLSSLAWHFKADYYISFVSSYFSFI